MTAVIEAEGVGFRRDGRQVLRDVSFSIEEHELVGLIGPNGGGKTTLIQVLLGVLRPYEGSVRIMGADPGHLDKVRRQIGYVAQAKQFDRDFPARAKDVVMMGTYAQVGLFRLPRWREHEFAMKALEQVGMAGKSHRPIGRLSGGEQQRVFIAQALVSKPKLMILDEPTAGVDREGEESLIRLLTQLRQESGLTILMVSHNVSLIRAHTDRILCINREIAFSGPSSTLTDADIARAYHAHPPEDDHG